MKSFSEARKAFCTNLAALLQQFNYTPTIFSMKLNQAATSSGSLKSVVSSEDVAGFLAGTKMPSVYALYKITQFFNITIDSLLSSAPIQMTTVTGRSFAKHTSSSPKIAFINNTTNTNGVTDMTTKTTKTNKNTNSNTKKMRELVETRTSSTEYNMPLAYKILTSDMAQKEIANKIGVTAGSLRDYSYYSVSMEQSVAQKLAKVLNTTTTNLGLRLNKDTMRFETVTK